MENNAIQSNTYKPYQTINKHVETTINSHYTNNNFLYLALANWKTILQCLFMDIRGIPLVEYLTKTHHPMQFHYGIQDSPHQTIEQLIRNTTQYIIQELSKYNYKKVIHLGCGIGGVDFQIANALPKLRILGVTISQGQYQLANALSKKLHIADRVQFLLQNYLTLPESFDTSFDSAYAIESLGYTPTKDLPKLFARTNALLIKDGRLLILDGFCTNKPLTNNQQLQYSQFLEGFDLPNLTDVDTYINICQKAGFKLEKNVELTDKILEMAREIKFRAIVGKFLIKLAQLTNNRYLKNRGFCGISAQKFAQTGIVQEELFRKHILNYHFLIFKKI